MVQVNVGHKLSEMWVKSYLVRIYENVGIKAKELVDWENEDNEWQSHPAVDVALNKKFTMKIKKKQDMKCGYKFVIEKILSAGLSEQNMGFLKRLELYYSYLLD